VIDDAKAEAKAKARAAASGADKLHADVLASLGLKDSIAREVGDGALRALLAVRTILGIDGAGGGAA
jgi:hypothetical protein